MPGHTKTLPDPFATDVHQDPYPAYRQLREAGPVHMSSIGVPTYYRYADCAAILRDRRWGCGFSEERLQRVARLGISQVFLHQNPPEHTRLRALVSKAFTPSSIAAMRKHVTEVCDQMLDSALATGEADLISAYAYPLPVTVISEMLGAPQGDHELFYGWSRALGRGLEPNFTMTAEILAQTGKAIVDFNAYFAALAKQRRECPADDLITRLTKVQENGSLSEADLLATCVLLLVAGHETTVNLIGNGIRALLRNPAQLAMVRDARPEIAKTWIDELLRYDAPVQFMKRTALEDLDHGGVSYKRGDTVAVIIGSANHDAAVFTEPEVLDLARPNNHMGFGLGIHFCLGAALARLEGSLAITTLLRRAPDLRLAEDNPPYRENVVIRGLERLPVRFGKRSH
jgi:hypothetical protein